MIEFGNYHLLYECFWYVKCLMNFVYDINCEGIWKKSRIWVIDQIDTNSYAL